jgi:hypothetical protein
VGGNGANRAKQKPLWVEFGGVGGGKDFYAIRSGFGTLCRWNLGVWVVGRTFMPSGVVSQRCELAHLPRVRCLSS